MAIKMLHSEKGISQKKAFVVVKSSKIYISACLKITIVSIGVYTHIHQAIQTLSNTALFKFFHSYHPYFCLICKI